jgi:hypoxanthine phosphoribosyltransferase
MGVTYKTLIGKEEMYKRIEELGKEISRDYAGKEVTCICVLKGGVMFMADLVKSITQPLTMDFMAVSSYGNETSSTGVVKIIKDLDESVEGKDVLIVEDIIDSGRTLSYLVKLIEERNPNSVKVCTLLDKPDRRIIEVDVNYVGFSIPDEFVIGYGLDYQQNYRNLPYIAIVENID